MNLKFPPQISLISDQLFICPCIFLGGPQVPATCVGGGARSDFEAACQRSQEPHAFVLGIYACLYVQHSFIYLYTYPYSYIYTYIYVYQSRMPLSSVSTRVCMCDTHSYIYILIHIHIFIHIGMYIRAACLYTRYSFVFVCTKLIHTSISIYTYIHIHIHIHINIYLDMSRTSHVTHLLVQDPKSRMPLSSVSIRMCVYRDSFICRGMSHICLSKISRSACLYPRYLYVFVCERLVHISIYICIYIYIHFFILMIHTHIYIYIYILACRARVMSHIFLSKISKAAFLDPRYPYSFIYLYIYIYKHIFMYIYICIHSSIVGIYTHLCVRHSFIYLYIHIYKYIFMYIYICIQIHIHIYIYISILAYRSRVMTHTSLSNVPKSRILGVYTRREVSECRQFFWRACAVTHFIHRGMSRTSHVTHVLV